MSQSINPVAEFKDLMRLYDVSRDAYAPRTLDMAAFKDRHGRRFWGLDNTGRVYAHLPIRVAYGPAYMKQLLLTDDPRTSPVSFTPETTLIIHQHRLDQDRLFSVVTTIGLLTNRVMFGQSGCSFSGMTDLLSGITLFAYGTKFTDLGEPKEDPRFWVQIALRR